MSVKRLMKEEIKKELGDLKTAQLGSDDYKTTIDGITKLADRVIEIEKLETEQAERAIDREIELELKEKQMEEERKDRKIKNVLTAAGIVIPTGVTIWGTLKSFKFEQEGTITTIMGRGFIYKLLPKK